MITPSEEKVKPAGNAGETVNVRVPVPPVAVTGVNDVAAIFCCNVLVGITVFATKGIESTDNENVSDLDCGGDPESVTVTVYVVAGDAAALVPVISPVDELRVNPVGNGGAIVNVNAPEPPVATTGV